MDGREIHDRIRQLRRETAELRRITRDKIERANEGIQRADVRIAELQRRWPRAALNATPHGRRSICSSRRSRASDT